MKVCSFPAGKNIDSVGYGVDFSLSAYSSCIISLSHETLHVFQPFKKIYLFLSLPVCARSKRGALFQEKMRPEKGETLSLKTNSHLKGDNTEPGRVHSPESISI